MKMYPWEDQEKKQRFYFQSEVAIKNEQFGVVLWTGLLLGKFPDTGTGSSGMNFEFQHRMMLLQKTDEVGSIKKGYEGADASSPSGFNQEANFLTLKTPNEYGLNRSKIEEISETRSWLGVGEEEQDLIDAATTTGSSPKKDDGNHPLKDIDIAIGSFSDDDEPDREVYGLTESQTFAEKNSVGYNHGSYFYETDKGKKMSSVKVGDKLNNGYSIFKDKKGKGTEINKRCYDLSVTRTTSLDIDQLRDLCYIKK